MKIKFFPFFLLIIFVLIFIIFYKGLNKSNIYTPNNIKKKKFPIFLENYLNKKKIDLQMKFLKKKNSI